jgi:hypothetical protein
MVRALCVALASAAICAGCGRDQRPEPLPVPRNEAAPAAVSAVVPAPAAAVPAVAPKEAAPPSETAPAKEAAAGPKKVTLAYGGELEGYLMPCGCADGMLGGLPRKAGFLSKLRREAKGAFLNVDIGNLVKEPSEQSELKFTTILEAFVLIGCDALCLGERDLALGGGAIKGEFVNRRQIAVVVGNLKVDELKELVQPFRIMDAKGTTVFVTGLIDPELVSGMQGVVCEEPLAAGRALEEKAKACDLKVLLAHASVERAKAWAKELAFFDVVVCGVGQEDPLTPEKVGRAALVAPGVWGKYGCALNLTRGSDGAWGYEFVKEPIAKELGNDSDVLQLIKDYQRMLAQREGVLAPPRVPHPGGLFTGTKRCAECHTKAYQVFEKSRHAQALATLKEVESHVDPECLPCHTVGYKYEGGFTTAQETPEFGDVGCESCHGPGARHVEEGDAKSIDRGGEETCKECHKELRSPGFNYKEYFKRIAHPEK